MLATGDSVNDTLDLNENDVSHQNYTMAHTGLSSRTYNEHIQLSYDLKPNNSAVCNFCAFNLRLRGARRVCAA